MAKFPFTDADIDNVELVRQMVLHRLRTDATYSHLGGAVGTYDQLVEFESPDYGLRQPPARRSRTPEAASAVRPTRDREIGRMHTHRRGSAYSATRPDDGPSTRSPTRPGASGWSGCRSQVIAMELTNHLLAAARRCLEIRVPLAIGGPLADVRGPNRVAEV
jgi:hypothetical protein